MKRQIVKVMSMFFFFGVPIIFFLACQGFAVGMADYGDNPDSYKTLSASNGPQHLIGDFEWLGHNSPDYEMDGQPTPFSNGDDLNGIDDEDGITFVGTVDPVTGAIIDPTRYWGGLYGQVDILAMVQQWNGTSWDGTSYSANRPLYIDGWIDWNHDGDYDDSGIMPAGPNAGAAWSEHVVSFSTDPSTWGQNSMLFSPIFLNGWGPTGAIYSRWRLNYNEGVNEYFGMKMSGEVEDYGPLPDKDQAPVPEPSTMLLLCFGLIGFAGFIRKSKRA